MMMVVIVLNMMMITFITIVLIITMITIINNADDHKVVMATSMTS